MNQKESLNRGKFVDLRMGIWYYIVIEYGLLLVRQARPISVILRNRIAVFGLVFFPHRRHWELPVMTVPPVYSVLSCFSHDRVTMSKDTKNENLQGNQ